MHPGAPGMGDIGSRPRAPNFRDANFWEKNIIFDNTTLYSSLINEIVLHSLLFCNSVTLETKHLILLFIRSLE